MLATIIAEVGEWNRSTTKPVKGEAEVIFKPVRVAEVIVITIWCFHSAHPTGWAEFKSGIEVCDYVTMCVRHHFEDDHYFCS